MILVTGGTGLLGSHVIVQLLVAGKHIRATHREGSNLNAVQKTAAYYNIDLKKHLDQLEWVQADLLDINELNDAFEGVKQVFHCAAVVGFSPDTSSAVLYDNPTSTANVVNIALDHKIDKLVYASSVAALGRKTDHDYINEDSDWVESKNNSDYAKGKYRAEMEVWRAIQEGLNAVIVNPSIIIGPGNWKSGSSGMFGVVARGLKYYTQGANAYVDVRDVSEIMIKLLNSTISSERFIVAAENISYKKFFEFIAAGFQIKAPDIKIGPKLSEWVWRLEWLRSKLFRSKPFITKETARTAQKTYYYENEKVKKALNFNFRRVEDSVKEICDFYYKDLKETKN